MDLPKNVEARLELVDGCLAFLQNGVSVVARDVTQNMIVGFCINTLKVIMFILFIFNLDNIFHYEQTYDEHHKPSYNIPDVYLKPRNEIYKSYMEFEVPVNLLQHYGIECLFEIVFVSTRDSHAGSGIGRKLLEFSVELAQRLKNGDCFEYLSDVLREQDKQPQVVAAILSSAISQHIGIQLGFKPNGSLMYDQVMFNGKTIAERLKDKQHTSATLMSKLL